MTTDSTRWQEIRTIHRDYKFFYQIGGGAALVLFGILIGAALFTGDRPLVSDTSGYTTNLFTEVLSIGITVFILDLLAQKRNKETYKRQLIRQMSNPNNGIALQALWELIAENWTTDGSLEEKYFVGTNLEGAVLLNAKMNKAVFTSANLAQASLMNTSLQKAELTGANLQGAYLWNSDLRNARLIFTDLRDARLGGADLRGAYMVDAILEKAIFADKFLNMFAILDETTVLPDYTHYDPKNGLEQLARFTDPNHPKFWRSDDPLPPAYRAKPQSQS